jgi:phosphoglycolate phosphatase
MIEKDTLIFDFDGTLADTLAINHQIMNALSVKYNFKSLSCDEVKQLKMLPARQVLRYMAIAPYKIPFVMAAGKSRLQSRIDDIAILPGFCQLLTRFKQHYRLAVVTTNSSKNVSRFLANHKIDFIDFIYADTRLSGKAGVLKKAIKKQALTPSKTLYIGDEIRDIKAAKAAGIGIVAVSWGYNTKAVLAEHNPEYLVSTLEQLEEAVADHFKVMS